MWETAIRHQDLTSERKAELRAQAASLRRKAWLHAGAAASLALADNGLKLIASFPGTRIAGGYYPVRDELDPRPLLEGLRQEDIQIALPKALPGPALVFRQWMLGARLEKGRFGICEPLATEPVLRPDCILVPLLAFDRWGNRLGYGAGFYDAALRKIRRSHRISAVGVAFDEQEFAELPREPQDELLDMVLTPTRVIACGE